MVVGDLLVRGANKFPKKMAIITEDISLTYEALNERVNGLANALLAMGLRREDHVGVLIQNCHQFVEVYFATAKNGGIFCPYNNLLKEKELIDIVNYSEPRFLFLDGEYGEIVDSIRPRLDSVEHYICLQKPRWSYMKDYESLTSDGEKREPGVKVRDDDVMSIFFTAGTTGKPKGAMRTHRHIITTSVSTVFELKVTYDERVLITFPMYHVSYEDHIGRCFLVPNTTIIRKGRFIPEEVLTVLSREKITMALFVPTMINALLQCSDIERYDLSNLGLISYVGAPMPVELLKKALKTFGNFGSRFCQHYGQTESGPFMTFLPPEDHILDGPARQLGKLASAGRPVLDYEVRIVDEHGSDVPIGEVGEIIGRSEATMKGYWQLPQETVEKLKNGWLYTGDLGKFDEDGYVYIVDRKNDLIISGGKNIYPREVEEVLYQHPAVIEATVIGVPEDYWGEAVKAIIVPREGAAVSDEEIINFCGKHLAGYKKPKSVEFWKELPKSPQGKILKRVIRERYWKDTGRTI